MLWNVCGEVCYVYVNLFCGDGTDKNKIIFIFILDVDMDPNYEKLGHTLARFTEPTSKSGGFINDVPEVEVRIQVRFYYGFLGFKGEVIRVVVRSFLGHINLIVKIFHNQLVQSLLRLL